MSAWSLFEKVVAGTLLFVCVTVIGLCVARVSDLATAQGLKEERAARITGDEKLEKKFEALITKVDAHISSNIAVTTELKTLVQVLRENGKNEKD